MRVLGSSSARRVAGWALRAVGPIVLAFLLVRIVDYGELRELLRDLQYWWLLAALGAMQLAVLLFTLRWIELHRAFGLRRAPFSYQLRLTYATSLASLVLPQIVNPLSRLALLLQDGYRTGRSLAASISEKLLDVASYILFGVIGSAALSSTFRGAVWWATGLGVVAVLGTWIAYVARWRLRAIVMLLVARLPGARRDEADISETAEDILSLDPAVAVRLLLWSSAILLTQATVLFCITRSLGVDLSYPFIVAVSGIIALSLLLPLSVNAVGTREAILVTAFSAVHRSTDAAVAAGLLTLVIAGIGTSPGLIEWVRRALVGGEGRLEEPTAAAESGSAG